ncbi:hypothetical protein NLJ89_g2467 [Agrocybe chaxingu]|uniref:Xylanolytic transcriptional activator regulatory domain-containing protein n=1 Tax=Agrocybe chaxingu TaxID=84603 RepID=A0A9W8MY27_9AGAR|nr:hypothetical protein NLJ89_g2467 [Agrocybe chaxingu]
MQCSNFLFSTSEVQYSSSAQRRAPSKKYITSLENRLERLEKATRQLCPDESIYDAWIDTLSKEPTPPPPARQLPPLSISRSAASQCIACSLHASHGYTSPNPPLPEEEDDRADIIATSLDTNRFFGRSSSETLVRKALSIKKQCVGDNSERPILSRRREEYWTFRPWERKVTISSSHHYTFPDPDLARDLAELYFQNIHPDIPLLHRPSFERSVRDGLHYADEGFADVYLLVCALGARFSSDPKVLLEGVDSRHSAGWKWFNQVELCKGSPLGMPSLYDIQAYCLTIIFLQFATTVQSIWLHVGVAIRLIQDVGIHAQKTTIPTVKDELWKRAFWHALYLRCRETFLLTTFSRILVYFDRHVSIGFGRPLTILEEDFDADLPIECDDEYWEHPDPQKRFKQPPNKPSLMSAFLQQLKLMKIFSTCNRIIYPIHKLTTDLGLDDEHRKSNIVAELDSSLNKWLRELPEHLRWDPKHPHERFFLQSARLHTMYYHIQIFIHRPFITSPTNPTSSSSLSLAICSTAARASINIAEVQLQRGVLPQPLMQFIVFTSAIVLLTGLWLRKAHGLDLSSVEQNLDMEPVRTSLQILAACEDTCPQAGKFRDVLSFMSERHDGGHPSTDSVGHQLFGEGLTTQPAASAVWLDNDAHLSLVRNILIQMLSTGEPAQNEEYPSNRHYPSASPPESSSFDISSLFNTPQELNASFRSVHFAGSIADLDYLVRLEYWHAFMAGPFPEWT